MTTQPEELAEGERSPTRARIAALVSQPPSNEEEAGAPGDDALGEGWWEPPAAELDSQQVERLAREWGFKADELLEGLADEVASLKNFGVYEEVDASVAGGADILKIGVIFKSKGNKVKARIVAKDYAVTKRDDLWTATPSMTGVRTVLALSLIHI